MVIFLSKRARNISNKPLQSVCIYIGMQLIYKQCAMYISEVFEIKYFSFFTVK